MPRRLRLRIAGQPQHIVHRGIDRGVCFRTSEDHELYLGLLQEHGRRHGCGIHAYVLMTNHLHLLVTPDRPGAVSNLMKDVAQRYTQHCNRTWKRTGPLWEGRFHSCIVDSETYLLRCHRYIEMNPVRAKMVGHPAEWRWSSHRSNALGMPSPILTPHAVFTALAADEADRRIAYREWFDLPESPLALELIRQAVRGGFALGPDDFIARLEAQLGKRAKRARRRSAASEVGQLSGLTPV